MDDDVPGAHPDEGRLRQMARSNVTSLTYER